MSLKQQLAEELKVAMKEKDIVKKNAVQMVRAAILNYEKDNLKELDDEGVLDIIAKELKKRKSSLIEYEKSNREDLINELKSEIVILTNYLPTQLSDEELAKIVKNTIDELGANSIKEMGKVMGVIIPKVKGKADNDRVGQMVKHNLNQ
ncbi:MAG: aspartyl-tRNA amidotransferase [Clostridiales bacterium GWE2_32_10]|nr:MAG: aspartyl-tRNA amidotransferase [Clostridiales bacterium GWE2_32_10]HBY20015.1 aspartyl-tRNA amidotransferase [Clostridiales bacterium]